MDIRKYGIAIAIAIVTAIFIYSVADAVAPQVDYDTCYKARYVEPVRMVGANCSDVRDVDAEKTCIEQGYTYEPSRFDANGCATEYVCNTCYKEQQEKQERHNAVVFYVAVALGILAIIVGFMLPLGTVHEWVGLGFIIGGVISMFIGTVQYWGDLARIARPFVIGLELAVLLFIVYRRMNTGGKRKR